MLDVPKYSMNYYSVANPFFTYDAINMPISYSYLFLRTSLSNIYFFICEGNFYLLVSHRKSGRDLSAPGIREPLRGCATCDCTQFYVRASTVWSCSSVKLQAERSYSEARIAGNVTLSLGAINDWQTPQKIPEYY